MGRMKELFMQMNADAGTGSWDEVQTQIDTYDDSALVEPDTKELIKVGVDGASGD